MPLEISEIGIRLAVGEPASTNTPMPLEERGAEPPQLAPHEIDELVRRCVQEVLASLRLMGER